MTSNKWKAVDNISIKCRGLIIFYNVKDTLTGALYDISSCLCISYNKFFLELWRENFPENEHSVSNNFTSELI